MKTIIAIAAALSVAVNYDLMPLGRFVGHLSEIGESR